MKQFIDNFRKYLYLLSQLVKKNIKLRYRRSYLGMLWTLIEPLLTMIVLSVVFGSMLGRNSSDLAFAGVPFPIYVLTGRLLYSFFSSATNSAMRSIRSNGAMIKKVYVPKYIYPFSGILANFIIFLDCAGRRYGILCCQWFVPCTNEWLHGSFRCAPCQLVYSGNGSGHDPGYPVCILQRY